MWRINFILFVFLFFWNSVVAQEYNRDDYVREFDNSFHLRVFLQHRPTALVVKDQENRAQLRFTPNATPSLGVGGNILDIGFALVVKLPSSFAFNKIEFDESRYHDFQLNYYRNRFALDFHYYFYEGFFLGGTKNLPELSLSNTILRPHLDTEGANLLGIYIFRPEKFSYRSYFNQANKQVKSGGSFIAMTSLDYFILNSSDSMLVPSVYKKSFHSPGSLEKGNFSSLAIMPGYSHTFVKGNFYLNFSFAFGPDFQYKVYNTESEKKNQWKLEGKFNLRGGFGYDNDKLFIALLYLNRGNNYGAGGLNLSHNSDLLRFTVGHRFPETQWMKRFRNSRLYQSITSLAP